MDAGPSCFGETLGDTPPLPLTLQLKDRPFNHYRETMCALYEIGMSQTDMLARYRSWQRGTGSVTPDVPPSEPIRPTDKAPVFFEGRALEWQSWGLKVDWQSHPLINARSETVLEKAAFAKARETRCLVPATGYFEWQKRQNKKHRLRISLPRHQPFFFAGLSDGECFTVLTCAPASSIAHIHHRMPVILAPSVLKEWLEPKVPLSALMHHLIPCPDKELEWKEAPAKAADAPLFDFLDDPEGVT